MSTVPAQARVTRRFDTSAERVFDAWLDVQRVRRWFGPRVSIEIAGIEGGCELLLVHDMPASAAALQERVEHGWRTMLDAMAADLRA
jgi:uncharacterized protein YndB with AHSA1/START domain